MTHPLSQTRLQEAATWLDHARTAAKTESGSLPHWQHLTLQAIGILQDLLEGPQAAYERPRKKRAKKSCAGSLTRP